MRRSALFLKEAWNRLNVPKEVLFRTLSRRRSPELIAESCGKRFIRRSACVPLPTPGAPTRIMRAALLNSLVGIASGAKTLDPRGSEGKQKMSSAGGLGADTSSPQRKK